MCIICVLRSAPLQLALYDVEEHLFLLLDSIYVLICSFTLIHILPLVWICLFYYPSFNVEYYNYQDFKLHKCKFEQRKLTTWNISAETDTVNLHSLNSAGVTSGSNEFFQSMVLKVGFTQSSSTNSTNG